MILSELLSLRVFPLMMSAVTAGHENGRGTVVVVVSEGNYIILPCSLSSQESLVRTRFDWKKDDEREVFVYDAGLHHNNRRSGQDEHFRGRVSHFSDQLKFGNASIIIRNTKVVDSGDYTCDFPFHQPDRETFNITLVVVFTGAAPKPFVGILNISEVGVQLKCEVRGASPKLRVEWRDSDGNILPAEEPQVSHRGERYDITLLTTVTRTNINHFHCVATQEELSHRATDEIFVPDQLFESCRGDTVLISFVSGILSALVVLCLCVCFIYTTA
ncbi:butyrophilin subfamily 2 member A2 isoform X1 [Oreochromis niloticus]|uniref:butyrophilin subfamily 2 member A2 isoform X1 n=1 Tax=Oreochromis niloticus TaxID=8128 RepID=UPI0009046E0D|nr:butyrophilin subfamily 2 member A2 isoform X1 [Oreochromis niloticus]